MTNKTRDLGKALGENKAVEMLKVTDATKTIVKRGLSRAKK